MSKKQLLIATIFTLLTVIAWVVFDIIHARSQVEISPKLQELIEPINPEFDLSGFESQ